MGTVLVGLVLSLVPGDERIVGETQVDGSSSKEQIAQQVNAYLATRAGGLVELPELVVESVRLGVANFAYTVYCKLRSDDLSARWDALSIADRAKLLKRAMPGKRWAHLVAAMAGSPAAKLTQVQRDSFSTLFGVRS